MNTTDQAKFTDFKYNKSSLEADIRRAFDTVGWKEYIKRDTRVFVKPNYTLPFFKPGVTTNDHVVEALLGVLKDRASEVFVGEADGGNNSFTAQYSLEGHGVPEMCKRTGTTMINLSKVERIKVTDKIAGKKVDVMLPRVLVGMDESISIPVPKVHVVVKTSLSFKNLWGCHPDSMRTLDHTDLSEKLALIAKSINLRLCLVDGIYWLNRRGPMDGDVVNMGTMFACNNPVATDATMARIMGFEPEKVHHIAVAHKAGLGPVEKDKI
jgi:uncharacterized protein (DUF362 family)